MGLLEGCQMRLTMVLRPGWEVNSKYTFLNLLVLFYFHGYTYTAIFFSPAASKLTCTDVLSVSASIYSTRLVCYAPASGILPPPSPIYYDKFKEHV